MEKKYNSSSNIYEEDTSINKELNFLLKYKDFIRNDLINIKNNLLKNKNNLEISEIIEDYKIRARTAYIDVKSEKTKMKLKEEFSNILRAINKEILNNLESDLNKMIDIKKTYADVKKENEILDSELSNINKDVRILNNKLLKKNDEISKWQIKFESFKNVMPFFEELIRLFPKRDPKSLIINFFEKKNQTIEDIHRLNELKENYFDELKKRDRILNIENKEKTNIESRINEERQLFETREKILNQELLLYQSHYDNLQSFNKTKQYLKSVLFDLFKKMVKYISFHNYNAFIKKIGYNPIKNEKEFDISIFDNKYFLDLIEQCIVNKASDCNDGKLLRNTIIFANYLLRKYLSKNKTKIYRYEPVKTLRELKSYVDNINDENNILKALIINLKQKQSDLKYKRKNLEKLITKSKIEYKELLIKLEKAKKIQLTLFKSKNNNKYLEFEKSDIEENKLSNKNIYNEKDSKLIKSKSYNNFKTDINNKGNLFKTIDHYNINRTSKLFITRTDKIKKKRNIYKETNKFIKNEKLKINVGKEEEIKKIMKSFKTINNIKISSNKDKLYKTNGFNSSGNILLQTKNLLKEINASENEKIFKTAKYNPFKNGKLTIETYEEFPISFISNRIKNKKIKKFKTYKSKRQFTNLLNAGDNYKMISNKIIKNIDNIINSLSGIKANDIKIGENSNSST